MSERSIPTRQELDQAVARDTKKQEETLGPRVLGQPIRRHYPYIIGEFASCHEGMLSRALQGITVAANTGCDAVKFQYFSVPARMRERRKIDLEASNYNEGSIPAEWFGNIRDFCKEREVAFICSVFLPEDVGFVSKWVDGFKVSSFESKDRELTRAISAIRGDRPFFISTGMQEAHDDTYLPTTCIKLHCVSAYPCPLEEANLGAIELGEGYSDHTRCVFTGAFAVSAGASFLEVHYRLDDTSQNCPDYVVALTPKELARYIRLANAAFIMRGHGRKVPMESEKANMRYRVVK